MAQNEIYRRKICELCGKVAFEKHLGTSSVLDGGFTRNECFAKSGFGAMVVTYWGIEDLERVDLHLCPDCAKQIDLALRNEIEKLKTKVGEENE